MEYVLKYYHHKLHGRIIIVVHYYNIPWWDGAIEFYAGVAVYDRIGAMPHVLTCIEPIVAIDQNTGKPLAIGKTDVRRMLLTIK